MDIRKASFVREVNPEESVDEVVNEAKALTWVHRCEHALLKTADGRFLLIRGGADGIELELAGEAVMFRSGEIEARVAAILWHTHPRPTGPSDHDRRLLRLLGQSHSRIYEMFGDGGGFVYRGEDRRGEP